MGQEMEVEENGQQQQGVEALQQQDVEALQQQDVEALQQQDVEALQQQEIKTLQQDVKALQQHIEVEIVQQEEMETQEQQPSGQKPSGDQKDPDYSPSSRGSCSRHKKTNLAPLKCPLYNPGSCKISDNIADSCKTHCKICGEAFFLVKMRSHTLQCHNIQITRYKELYGLFEIIEKVFHKCRLCGKIVLMDSDALGAHIKGKHKMKEKDYKEK